MVAAAVAAAVLLVAGTAGSDATEWSAGICQCDAAGNEELRRLQTRDAECQRLEPPPPARGLEVLDCEGGAYDPKWKAFRVQLEEELPSWTLLELRNAHRTLITDLPTLPPVSVPLARRATVLAQACLDWAHHFARDWHFFDRDLANGGFGEAEGPSWHRWWVDSSVPDEGSASDEDGGGGAPGMDGLCLYGCAAAQIVLALIALQYLPFGEDFAEGSAQAELHLEAVRRLQLASGLMGKVEQAFDFGTSSAWGVTPAIALTMLEFFQWTRREATAAGPEARPSALELARLRQPCDPILASGCWVSSSSSAPPSSSAASPLAVTVFGDHGPLSRDALQSLEEAAASLGLRVEAVVAGDYYLCHGEACDQDPTRELLKAWVHRWSSGAPSPTEEADALLAALQRHPRPRAARPDLLFCTNIAVHCWLLQRRTSEQAFTHVPALHLLGMAFLANVPPSWRREIMADFRARWESSSEPVADVFSSYMEALSLQLQWQIGISVPFVPTVGLARREGAAYDPPDDVAGHGRTVIVLRSAFWSLPAGLVFASLAERFAAANRATHRTAFRWLGRYTSIAAEDAKSEPVTWHSFDDIASHTCALDIPAEFSQIKFRDVYSMGLPLLFPEDQWMLRLFKKMYRSWGQLNSEWSDQLPLGVGGGGGGRGEANEIAAAAREWPHAPFYNGAEDSLARLEYWLPLADHARYPHTIRFSSLPHLLDVIVRTGWAEVSVKMRAHFRRVVRNVHRFYRASLLLLLEPRVVVAGSKEEDEEGEEQRAALRRIAAGK